MTLQIQSLKPGAFNPAPQPKPVEVEVEIKV
jgi:hypothetical protein